MRPGSRAGRTPHGTSHRLPDQSRPDRPVECCMRVWIYAYADITLNLRCVQMSPSICVVADDEYDRNHSSPSRVVLQLLNAELLREIIRKTPPRTP